MKRLIFLRMILAAATIAAVCAPLAAQTQSGKDQSATRLKIKPVPEAHRPPAVFTRQSDSAAGGAGGVSHL